MQPGPDQIIACPSCKTLAKYATLLSGNTFGARVWTDGKQEAPMLPQPPPVVKCRHCAACFWLVDAEPVGELDLWGADPLEPATGWPAAVDHPLSAPPTWRAAEYVEELSEADYYAAIRAGLAKGPKQERALRIFAWWRGNEPYRDGEDLFSSPPPPQAGRDENLRRLLPLLDGDTDSDRIMRGEVLRELGRWSEAEAALLRIESPDFAPAVAQILALCRAQDRAVRELRFD